MSISLLFHRGVGFTVCLVLLCARVSGAQVVVTTPHAKLTATTNGQATAQAGADIFVVTHGQKDWEGWALGFSPVVLVTTTNGVGTIFSSNGSDITNSIPIRLGLETTYYYIPRLPDDTLETPFPLRIVSLGFLAGWDSFKYLSTTSPDLTLVKNEQHGYGLLGFYFATIPPSLAGDLIPSLELTLSSEWKHQASTTQAMWCVPAGSVARPDGTGTDAAQICDKQPLGAPKSMEVFSASALAGAADRKGALWRFAAGPFFLRMGDDSGVGFALAVYIRFAAPSDFKGIIKLAVNAEWRIGGTGLPDQRVFATLEVLARKTLFGSALQ